MDPITQQRIRTAGIYIPLLTGTLSVLGSGSILYSIYARRTIKLKDPQHRILGMMSIFDILYSINKALMFLTYPSGLGVPTFGNSWTCALQGFFTQFGYAAGSYNLVLSLYYFLIINRGMSKEEFGKCWEKILHGIVIICHVSFAIIGVSIGLFNPTPGFCYITPGSYGTKCSLAGDNCKFQSTAAYFYEAFAQGWIQLAYVVIIVTNLLIWLYVRRQEQQMKKYRTTATTTTATTTAVGQGGGDDNQLSEMEKKSSYARNVFIQSMLYVGAFVLSWSWATVFHLVAWTTGVSVPWITLLINTFLPLQGFWNAFIYARPRYIRLKKQHAHLGCIDIVKLVFFPPKEGGVGVVGSRTTTRNENVSTLRSAVDVDDSERSGDDRESGVFKSFMASMKRNKGMRTSSSSFQDSQQTIKASGRARPAPPIEVVDEEEGENGDGDKGEMDEAKNAAEGEWPENTPSPPASGEK